MAGAEDRIEELEHLIAHSQYNKRTQHAIGLYKAQLARLREKQEARRAAKAAKQGEGYAVRKTGDGTVVLLGFPSVGKSTLLNCLTNAESRVAHYSFTTLQVIPGVMEYEHAKIQVLDVPGVVQGAAAGRGRGTEVFAVLRNADLIVLLLDVHHPEQCEVLLRELRGAHIRANAKPPDVKVRKTSKGGVKIGKTRRLTKLTDETITAILQEFKINNADVVIREDITDDQFIDVLEGNKHYVPAITVVNKIDSAPPALVKKVAKRVKADLLVSAAQRERIDELKELVFQKLDLVRVYLKEPRKDPDLEVPLIMRRGCTVKRVCEKLHKDFVDKFKFCRVWGKSAKFPGQKQMLLHVLRDGDILELHLR
ncbi:GTP-binding protein [Candidatus Woesearchaeota archaeon]|nr:GTP-binding protein [Candidatus Woesearchaeota archaeon]